MDAPVLLPAGLVVLLAHRAVLAVADDRKLVVGDAHLDSIRTLAENTVNEVRDLALLLRPGTRAR